jgi:hypothetical protein
MSKERQQPSLADVLIDPKMPKVLLPEESFVRSFRGFIKDHPGLLSLGVILLAAGGGATLARITDDQPVAQIISANQQENYKLQDTENLVSTDYIKIAMALLKERGLNLNDQSFEDEMLMQGYSVQFEIFGSPAKTEKAGKEGLKVRWTPSLEIMYETEKNINAGDKFSYIARVKVNSIKDKTTDVYGLLENPIQTFTIIDKNAPLPDAPNVIKLSGGGFRQIRPGYVRLERIQPDGSINKFTQN